MKSLLISVFGVSLLAGCAVAPYDYGYRSSYYDAPAYYGYYDYGPTYYYGPGYYGGDVVGPPVVAGSFRYRSDARHWNGGSRQRNTVQSGRTSQRPTVASANPRGGRNAGMQRGSAPRQRDNANAREREPRRVAGRTAPSDHGS
jgi:hypothetical protein